MVETHTVGIFVVLISTVLYIYYTVWILVTPIIDEDH